MQFCFSKTHPFIKRNCDISILKEGAFKYFSYDFLGVSLHEGKMKTMSPKWKDFQNLPSGISKFTETYIWVFLVRC